MKENNKKQNLQQAGITLVALVVTNIQFLTDFFY